MKVPTIGTQDYIHLAAGLARAANEHEGTGLGLLLIDAANLMRRLGDELSKRLVCPQCKGSGQKWYPLSGMGACLECRGSGEKP